MKNIISTSLLFILSVNFCSAQSLNIKDMIPQSQFEEVEDAVNLYWVWETDSDPINAVKQLEKIANNYEDNWLAPYWAAYISTQISNSLKKQEYLDKARIFYNTADSRILIKSPSDTLYSYFKGLNSLIYRLKGFNTNDEDELKELESLALGELNEGIKLKADNPVLWVLAATDSKLDHRNNLGQRLTSMALLRMAKKEFKNIKDRNKADITYWNEHWIDPWLNNLTPIIIKEKK